MKIQKFATGGTYVPPLASYTPVTVSNPGRPTSALSPEDSKQTSADLTDKDLLKMLEHLDGLPSDMQKLTSSLQSFYFDQQFGPSTTSNIASRYLGILAQMKTANFNNKQFEKAYDAVSENGGINEFAINERGQLFCTNGENDFKLIKPEDLKDNEGYTPLTNAELLKLRAYNTDLAFNNTILGVVQNGIGIETVNKYIKDIINGLGTTSNTEEGYVSTQQGKLIKGLNDLNQALQSAKSNNVDFNGTTDDLYSYKILTRDQKTQADAALLYIMQSLPENAKALIKTKTKNGTQKEVLDFVSAMVFSNLSGTTDYTIKLEAGPSHKKASAEKTPIDKTKLNPAALIQAGYGQKDSFTIQTSSGGSNGVQINTVRLPIVSKEGKSMGVGTLDDVASSGFAGYLDFENASMGGVNIDPSAFNNVVVNGTSLYVGELPIDINRYSETGDIVPDIAMLGRYKQAQQEIKKDNISDPNEINNIYQKYNLPIMYGPNGDILTNYRKFGILNGSAIDKAFKEKAEFSDYLEETVDENEVENIVSRLQKGRGKEDKLDFQEKGFFNSWWGGYNHIYKGTVFIPVNEDYFSGSVGFGDFPSPEEAETIESKQQALQREKAANATYINPGLL